MTERQDPFEPRPETPETFVIRTPLTEAQETALVDWVVRVGRGDSVSFTDLLRAVGVRVESSAPVVGYIPDDVLEDFSSEEPMDGIEDVILRDPCTGYTPIIRQSDHLAALAEKEAEVQRLRIAECKMKEASVHLLRTMERSNLTKTERVNAAIRQINALFIPELTGSAP